jgi:hypothetical protein
VVARPAQSATHVDMTRLSSRHLDARRSLTPRDYLADPWAYGERPSHMVMPDGGDQLSQRVALVQHELIREFRADATLAPGTVCKIFGIHRNTWSRTMNGHRWAGETVMVALVWATKRNQR